MIQQRVDSMQLHMIALSVRQLADSTAALADAEGTYATNPARAQLDNCVVSLHFVAQSLEREARQLSSSRRYRP